MLARDTQKLRAWIAERLGTNEGSDYPATWAGIMSQRATRKDHKAAGVLLLLGPSPQKPDVISFHLIKRARVVSQGGDISCPGGMLDPPIDRLLKSLIHAYLLPTMVGAPRTYAQRRGKETFRLIELFFATGLRETWEEIGLLPGRSAFLAPFLPIPFPSFPGLFFPLWLGSPIPEKCTPTRKSKNPPCSPDGFFEPSNYTNFAISSEEAPSYHRESPAFIIRDEEGTTEILWGATFNIILMFLRATFDFILPTIPPSAVQYRVLASHYLTGERGS